MIRWIVPASIVVAIASLALGFGTGGWWTWTPPIAAVGGIWLLGQRRQWEWIASLGLVSCVVLAAAGLWLDLAVSGMLLALVAALTAWDLDHLARRLTMARESEQARLLEQRHLQRLLIVDALGLLLPLVGLEIEFEFGLTLALVLGLLAVVGLGQVVSFLSRGSGQA